MNGNWRELAVVRKKAADALTMLAAVEALPRRRGSRVRWPNGVVWTRRGDNDWRAEDLLEDIPYKSTHIASERWELVKPNEGNES